ncbi:hypothetical protein J2847_004910, partial [Azospirillum agricola]|nr:hypothetical protein [Azospirillum agricola]
MTVSWNLSVFAKSPKHPIDRAGAARLTAAMPKASYLQRVPMTVSWNLSVFAKSPKHPIDRAGAARLT